MKKRVADLISDILFENKIENIYMITGGAAMHLNDALGNNKNFNIYHLHHEQSCAIAAESHARHYYHPCVVNVTAGPGAINALNGVFGAYVDSIPMIIISGQAKRSTLVTSYKDPNLRQLGDQEINICHAAEKMTKYITQLVDPYKVKYELEKIIYLAKEGRPGPCWIDIPIDVQGTLIETTNLKSFLPKTNESRKNKKKNLSNIQALQEKLFLAKRPLIYAGSGIRASKTERNLISLAENLNIPIVTSWNSNDLIWDDHPLNAGRPGTVGTRSGNYAVQTCDVLLVLGARLNIRQLSYNWDCFADKAWICHVDVDISELNKPTLKQNLKIHIDLKEFFELFEELDLVKLQFARKENWIKWSKWLVNLRKKYDRYDDLNEEKILNRQICPYFFINRFTSLLKENETIVFADGTACVAGFQAAVIKKGQRLYHNSGCASMGYELPAAIGAFNALRKKIFCVAGDGSIMMNLQDLATISLNNMPIIIFILDNYGYYSIKQTQNNFFPNRTTGCGNDSGLLFPDFEKIGIGFGIESMVIKTNLELTKNLKNIIYHPGPFLCILKIDTEVPFRPKVSSKKLADGSIKTSRLEDMSPFLPSKEHNQILKDAFEI